MLATSVIASRGHGAAIQRRLRTGDGNFCIVLAAPEHSAHKIALCAPAYVSGLAPSRKGQSSISERGDDCFGRTARLHGSRANRKCMPKPRFHSGSEIGLTASVIERLSAMIASAIC